MSSINGVNNSYARHRPTTSSDDTSRCEIISPVAERPPQKAAVLKIANLLCDAPSTRPLKRSNYHYDDSDDDDAESRTLHSGRDSLFDDAATMTSITSPPSSVCDDNEDRKQRETVDEDKSSFKKTSSSELISPSWSTDNSIRKVPLFERSLPKINLDEKLPTMEVTYLHSDHPFDSRRSHDISLPRPMLPPPISPASNSLPEPKFSSNVRRSSYGPSSPPSFQRPYSGSYSADSSLSRGSSPSREFGYHHSRQPEQKFPSGFRAPHGINVSESRDAYQMPPRKYSSEQGFRSAYPQSQKPEPHNFPQHHQYTGTSSRVFHETFQNSETSTEHPPPRFPRRMEMDTTHTTQPSSQNNYSYTRSPHTYPPSPHSHSYHHRPSSSSSSSGYDQQYQSAFTRLPRTSSSQPVTPTSPGIYSNSTDYFQRRASTQRDLMAISGTADQDAASQQLQLLQLQPQQQPHITILKPKRKRANPKQLKELNEVFEQTFFPSTELRIQLGKQLNMSPRTVQIWFQNKRQSWRQKTKPDMDMEDTDDGRKLTRKSSVLSLSSDDSPDIDASMDEMPSATTKKNFSSYAPCLTALSIPTKTPSSDCSSTSPKLISSRRAHPYQPKITVSSQPHKEATSPAQIPTPRTTPLLSA